MGRQPGHLDLAPLVDLGEKQKEINYRFIHKFEWDGLLGDGVVKESLYSFAEII